MTGRECRDATPPSNGSATPASAAVFEVAKRGTDVAAVWRSQTRMRLGGRSGVARRVCGWVSGLAQPDAYAVGPWNWLGGWNCDAPSMTRSGGTLGYGRAKQAA